MSIDYGSMFGFGILIEPEELHELILREKPVDYPEDDRFFSMILLRSTSILSVCSIATVMMIGLSVFLSLIRCRGMSLIVTSALIS